MRYIAAQFRTEIQMLEFLNDHLYGLADLSFFGYVVVTLLWMHVTMMGVTLYFHRDQAHRAIDLHPALRHFFRLWLWLSTGAPTKEWVAVHRKHHALCEREGDPHSPVLFGLKKVVLEGSELYMEQAHNKETQEKYGKGTPDDWLERNVYGRFTYTGIGILTVFDVIVFGVPGIIVLAFQLLTMPVLAAGIINGVCHAKGYRNYETNDASTNLWPLGLFLAGEELHNNHHAFPTSARFSHRPHEVDMGWLHLKVLEKLGLAKIRRVAAEPGVVEPVPSRDVGHAADMESLRALLVHRMHVLRHYMNNVTLPVLRRELDKLGDNTAAVMQSARGWLTWQPQMLAEDESQSLSDLIERHPALATVLEFRNELKEVWEGAHTSNERLLADFRRWCEKAEASGNQYLEEFVAYLKSLRAVPSLA
jgi:stearoyl-CoA desaturase (delta-9 desaturase)